MSDIGTSATMLTIHTKTILKGRLSRREEKYVFLNVSMLSCTSEIDGVSMNDVTSLHMGNNFLLWAGI